MSGRVSARSSEGCSWTVGTGRGQPWSLEAERRKRWRCPCRAEDAPRPCQTLLEESRPRYRRSEWKENQICQQVVQASERLNAVKELHQFAPRKLSGRIVLSTTDAVEHRAQATGAASLSHPCLVVTKVLHLLPRNHNDPGGLLRSFQESN